MRRLLRLVHAGELTRDGRDVVASQPNYVDFRDQQHTLKELGAFRATAIVRMGRTEGIGRSGSCERVRA